VEATHTGAGTLLTTYADKLLVSGPEAVTDDLRRAIRENRDEIMAAVCVTSQPTPWMWTMLSRYLDGTEVMARREGWKGPYRVSLAMLAAHVASFIGLHPAHDGPRLAPIIEEALRRDSGGGSPGRAA